MGQKINPIGFRLAFNKDWTSRWYANNQLFPQMLREDISVRHFLKKRLAHAAVSKVIIERPTKNAKITILSAIMYQSAMYVLLPESMFTLP